MSETNHGTTPQVKKMLLKYIGYIRHSGILVNGDAVLAPIPAIH